MARGFEHLVDGDTNDATDCEEDEGDNDNNGAVSSEIVAKFIMRGQLE